MQSEILKLVVFVPTSHSDIVRKALGDAGAGKIGNYSYCSFTISGSGRSLPLDGANPTIGSAGKYEEVIEDRIECLVDRRLAKSAIEAVRKVHPYEEVAFDLYPMISEESL